MALSSRSTGAADPPEKSTLPPVNAAGAVSYTLQESSTPFTTRVWRNSLTGTVNPSTYIWEPWFATATGSLNVTASRSTGGVPIATTTTVGSSSSSNNDAENVIFTGTMNISVLPESLFPTSFSYTRFDSSVQTGTEINESTGDAVSLTSNLFLWEDIDVQTQATADQSTQNAGSSQASQEFNVDVNKRFETQQMRFGLNFRNSEYSANTGEKVTGGSTTLSFRHRYSPFENVSADSTSTLRQSGFTESTTDQTSLTMQGVTTLLYRPPELPMTVHGSFRTFDETTTRNYRNTTTVSGNTESHVRTVFGSVGSNYLISPGLNASGGLSASLSQSDIKTTQAASGANGAASSSFAANGGIGYSAPSRELAGFDWSWNADANSEASMTSNEGMNLLQTTRVGHSGSRSISVPFLDLMQLSVSENMGANLGTDRGLVPNIGHSVALSRNLRKGKDWDLLQFNVSDSRNFGAAPVAYQLLSVQFTKGYDPDAFTSIVGNITFQTSRQTLGGTAAPSGGAASQWNDTTSGSLSYNQRNIFGEPNLNFTSEFIITPPSLFSTNAPADLAGSSTAGKSASVLGSQRWNNRLDYVLGKLRMRLLANMTKTELGLSESALFQISRSFE